MLSALRVFISCFSSFISLLVCVIIVSFLLLSVFKVFTSFIRLFISLDICAIVVSFLLLSALRVFTSCINSFISSACIIDISFLMLSTFTLFNSFNVFISFVISVISFLILVIVVSFLLLSSFSVFTSCIRSCIICSSSECFCFVLLSSFNGSFVAGCPFMFIPLILSNNSFFVFAILLLYVSSTVFRSCVYLCSNALIFSSITLSTYSL